MKLKIYRAIFIILLLGTIILIVLIAMKQLNSKENEKENEEDLETFSNVEIQNSETVQLKGYNVAGLSYFTYNGKLITEIADETQWKEYRK